MLDYLSVLRLFIYQKKVNQSFCIGGLVRIYTHWLSFSVWLKNNYYVLIMVVGKALCQCNTIVGCSIFDSSNYHQQLNLENILRINAHHEKKSLTQICNTSLYHKLPTRKRSQFLMWLNTVQLRSPGQTTYVRMSYDMIIFCKLIRVQNSYDILWK